MDRSIADGSGGAACVWVRKQPCRFAISSAAGTPLPETSATPAPSLPQSIGAGEGELNLVIWAGYAERGEVDPAFDWVTPFEEKTGCKINTTEMTDSNSGVNADQ